MLRFSQALVAAGLIVASGAMARADSSPYTPGVAFDVVLTQSASTETAHPGDTFYFKTVSDAKLGDIDLPAGTPGTGRFSTAIPAAGKTPGELALQADSLTAGAATIWVNIDPSVPPRGRYTSHKDIVLDPGMKFRVISIAPRKHDAALVTPPPPETPTTSNAVPAPAPSASSSNAP